MFRLTEEQENLIAKNIEGFRKYLESEAATGWQIEMENKEELFSNVLSEERIDNLSEKDFGKVVKSLWASAVWTNKDWLVDKILKENGISKLRHELKDLLFGTGSIDKRFDRFRKNIKHMGVSYISEILFTMSPDAYCLWNRRARDVLVFLGIPLQQVVRGKDYAESISALKLIRDELLKHGFKEPNFWNVDLFVWYLSSQVLPKLRKMEVKEEHRVEEKVEMGREIEIISDHPEAQGVLLELGRLSGFETYVSVTDRSKEYKGKKLGELATLSEIPEELRGVKDIERVDVIWFNKYAPPSYFFEVEDKGTMREALHRLYQARYLNAKFIIISPKENKLKFERWLETAPFKSAKEIYSFKTFGELVAFYNSTIKYHRLKTDFGID